MSTTVTRSPAAEIPPTGPAERSGFRRRRFTRYALVAVAVAYVSFLLLLPVGGIVWTVVDAGWHSVAETFAQPNVQHAFLLTGIIALITVVVTTVLGVLVARVLVRQHFRGKEFLNAMVDLPFALFYLLDAGATEAAGVVEGV